MRLIIYLWASYIYWLFCSDPQSPAKDKRRKFLQGSRSSYDFYQTTAGDGSDIRDQSSNTVGADQGQSESCANEVLSTARGAEQQLTAEIDRELNAIIKITLGRAKGTSASSRWDILFLCPVKIFLSFFSEFALILSDLYPTASKPTSKSHPNYHWNAARQLLDGKLVQPPSTL